MVTLINDIPITIYYVGTDYDDALTYFPFDSEESANDYRFDQSNSDDLNIYSATAYVDTSSLEKV